MAYQVAYEVAYQMAQSWPNQGQVEGTSHVAFCKNNVNSCRQGA